MGKRRRVGCFIISCLFVTLSVSEESLSETHYIKEEEILRLAPQDDKTGVTGVTFSYIYLMSTLYNLYVYTSFIFLVYNMYTS